MSWDEPLDYLTKDMAVHAVLLPTGTHGKILYFGGYDVDDTHLFDVDTAASAMSDPIEDIPAEVSPGYNIFCCGHAFLADGRVLIAGGQLPAAEPDLDVHEHGNMAGGGERSCAIYEPIKGLWRKPTEDVQPMNPDPAENPNSGGRWYPTLTTLHNGEVLAVGGHPDVREAYPDKPNKRHNNNTPERYNPSGNFWTLLASNPPTESQITAITTDHAYDYQRTHLLPNGQVFFSSPVRGKNRLYDPFNGIFLDNPTIDLPVGDNKYHQISAKYTSVMLPLLYQENYRPRVLLMGGEKAVRLDLGDASPHWVQAGDRNGPLNSNWSDPPDNGTPPQRNYVCPVILPSGEIFFSGGTRITGTDEEQQASAVFEGEIYEPGIDWQSGQFDFNNEKWQKVEKAKVERHYHSVALLLPNGTVWTAGSNGPSPVGTRELRIEIFKPSYIKPGRPVINACPKNIGYGFEFYIETPQYNNISRVALIRCGSCTHGFNPDQRYISLNFDKVQGQIDTLRVFSPPNSKIAPPGYYMLWIIDDQDRPCGWASFIRISDQKCEISNEISTFSKHEAETFSSFNNAIYVIYGGFLPSEVSEPSITIRWEDGDQNEVPGMTYSLEKKYHEGNAQELDTAQRIVYLYNIIFNDIKAFDEIPDVPGEPAYRVVIFRTEMKEFVCQTRLTLSLRPNPFMRDGDISWLSIDLKAFKTSSGTTEPFSAGVSHKSGENAPYEYIKALLDEYDKLPPDGTHPFNKIPTDLEANHLALYPKEGENDIYNYAIARVRFRAPLGTNAENVRVFFRLWTTGWTDLEYDTKRNYRRHGNGLNAAPLLGLVGGEITSIPCFAEARKPDMESQVDSINHKPIIEGKDANEVHTYFGCWLDVNRDMKLFPLEPPEDFNGPFSGNDQNPLKTIRELMRGLHQCIVAEIHYTLDPILEKATPSSSDNLAQRNIIFEETANPGSFSTHLVHHTFEIKPSSISLSHIIDSFLLTANIRHRPDELYIDWGNLPKDSHATFYLPQVNIDEILHAMSLRQSPPNLSKAGPHSLRCKVTEMGFIPIPGPSSSNLPGLLSIQLPPNLSKGQKFSIVVRQVDGRTHKVIGTFQFDILVKTSQDILPHANRNLSVLKHIAKAIPIENRWYPVFQRYLEELEDRIRGFGGNPDEIAPLPTGDETVEEERPIRNQVTGKISQILYDCFGDFEGFILDLCPDERRFNSKEKAIEEIVTRACCERILVTVYISSENKVRPYKIGLHCY
jgi:hypothetical protein